MNPCAPPVLNRVKREWLREPVASAPPADGAAATSQNPSRKRSLRLKWDGAMEPSSPLEAAGRLAKTPAAKTFRKENRKKFRSEDPLNL